MAKIRIISFIVRDENTTFYKEDGSSFDIPTADPRLNKVISTATPLITKGLVAEVDFDCVQTTHYREFEEKTNGFVKLFRVAKKFVQHIFADPHEEVEVAKPKPQTVGIIPSNQEAVAVEAAPEPEPTPEEKKLVNATQEILNRAQSVNDEKFTNDETTEEDTIIAVVKDDAGKDVIIPGMENLKDHMAIALKLGSTKGVENFLKRISTVINKRGHSIDDLLRFMQRNDMPIADDGSLVAFKTLNRRGNKAEEYQDIHSGNVVQRVGSKVFMKEGMVDPNRRNACSNGLHVARRAYCGGFKGSVMVLIKVAPEDAIAVPQYDGNKMRVCGYHIVGDVPQEDQATVYSNKPIGKDSRTGKLLSAVLKGDHIGIIELVEIGGARGGNLKVTKIGSEASNTLSKQEAEKKALAAEGVSSIDDSKNGANVSGIDAKEVASAVAKAKTAAAPVTKAVQARELFDNKQFDKLKEFKKAAKKSWSSLGFNSTEEAMITNTKADQTAPKAKNDTAVKAKNAPKKEVPVTEKKKPQTRAEVARMLFEQAVAGDKSRWGSLWQHQKSAKKSWSVLGFTAKEIERIKTNKPDHI